MNRNQPAAVIAAQQKLLEAASRQVISRDAICHLRIISVTNKNHPYFSEFTK